MCLPWSTLHSNLLCILETWHASSHALASQRRGKVAFPSGRQGHRLPLQCLPTWLGTTGVLWTLGALTLSHHFCAGKLTSSESSRDSELYERTRLPFPRLPCLAFTEAMGPDKSPHCPTACGGKELISQVMLSQSSPATPPTPPWLKDLS